MGSNSQRARHDEPQSKGILAHPAKYDGRLRGARPAWRSFKMTTNTTWKGHSEASSDVTEDSLEPVKNAVSSLSDVRDDRRLTACEEGRREDKERMG